MKSSWRLLLALLGTVLLVAMIRVIGVGAVVDGVRRAGWVLLPIMLVQLGVYSLNAWSWWLLFDPTQVRPSYLRTLGISVTGFALNFITPVVNAGGEPYRVAVLTPELGLRRATGSVLGYVMVHAVSSLLLWLGAIVTTLVFLPHTGIGTPALFGAAALVVVALGVVLSGHRDGVVVRIAALLATLRFRRWSAWLQARHETFAAVDAELVALWRDRPRRLIGAIAADTLSRLVGALEFFLIGLALGIPLAFTTSLAMWGLLALAMNLFFIFPWELGSREASIFGVTHLAGAPIEIAALAVVVGRVRELTWAALGMIVLWFETRRARGPTG